MASSERFHRFVRAIGSWYPLTFGAAWINKTLFRRFTRPPSNWLLAPGRGLFPTMVLDVSTTLQRKLFYFPRYYGRFYGKSPLLHLLRTRLRDGDVYLDIGSNVGFFALHAAHLVGATGRVHAFEPVPELSESLRKSGAASALPLTVHQVALSDRESEAMFFAAHDGTANSLVPETAGHEGRYERTLATRVTTLDKLVAEGAIQPSRIKLIKVDVEGEEPRTVLGMVKTLEAAKFPAIWCEVRGPKGSTRAPNTFPAVRESLAAIGYRPYLLSRTTRRSATEANVVRRADVLFERE